MGKLPFTARSQYDLFSLIKKGRYDLSTRFWNPISNEAKDFVKRLLTVKPKDRSTTTEALNHKWMKMSEGALSAQDLFENLMNFKKFNAKRKIRQTVFTVRSCAFCFRQISFSTLTLFLLAHCCQQNYESYCEQGIELEDVIPSF